MHEPHDAEDTAVGASDVRFDGDRLTVVLRNGDTASAPLWWFPRLCAAGAEERDRWRFYLVEGEGVEWPDLDEHVRIEDIMGQTGPSLESGRSFGKWLLARRAGRSVVLYDVYDYHADEPGPDIPDSYGTDSRVADVRTDGERLTVRLQTGGTVSVPLWWFPRLCAATSEERDRWETNAGCTVIRWPALGQVVPLACLAEQRGPDTATAAELSEWLLERHREAT